MIIIYTESSNASCRLAIQWFQDKGICYFERRICARHPLDKDELAKILLLTENGFDDVICYRSSIYSQIKKHFEDINYKKAIGLITEFPSLLKLPIIVDFKTSKIEVGFNEERIRCFLPRQYKRMTRKSIKDF